MKSHITHFWLAFLVGNVILTLVFAFIRMPIMDEDHFSTSENRSLRTFWDSVYISVMHQSTIGDSSIIPKTSGAIAISVAQACSIFVVYAFALFVLIKFT